MVRKRQADPRFENLTQLFDSIKPKPNEYVVFTDFIDLSINYYSPNYKVDLNHIQQRYDQNELNTFGLMFKECLEIMGKEFKTEKCFDLFGTFVRSHKTLNRYFDPHFTLPPELAKLMAMGKDYKNAKTFYNPSCGTARISLEVNGLKAGLFHTLIGKDYLCVKISALNLMLHGIDGIVVCDSALNPQSNFKGAFIVNRVLHIEKYPRIDHVDDSKVAYHYIDTRVPEKKIQAKFEELKKEQKDKRETKQKSGKNQKGMS